ncbi:hypothetical protein BU24DRAFT_444045 [Aaosphaeria arxii CBS 175.79]|uniref:Integral membrane protein TmpA n=1 Tax=Aaosphaeria arxii CBS 175.79 TaxID=1450172 RepID=A0A6A5XD69_9PLEO|nr:uncharacterized protein BU24DRAFT_444045 [Aaosphaeria arxii CBS 175.79]KAF2010747.1 hypothetical protein BU24DRAFT_444045 [Aaosphaeria arxii CBS 175.79]
MDPLPPKQPIRLLRHLRLSMLTVYRRIFTIIVLLNMIGLFLLIQSPAKLEDMSTWASANFLVAILFRQDWVVNIIFRSAWLVPWSMPLRLRRMVARAYMYGGVHSGAALAGTMWFFTFTLMLTVRFAGEGQYTNLIFVITWFILIVLAIICFLSLPNLRSKYHNTFEITHRFLGWSSILLFWTQLMLLIKSKSFHKQETFRTVLIRAPTFWNLLILTCLILAPWLRLRRWTFTPHVLSSHALRLHFTNRIHRFSCLAISISPFGEYHPFATFPSTNPSEPGSSLIISAAGDWTKEQIRIANDLIRENNAYNSEKKMTFWIKGSPKAGVLSLTCIFQRVVIITTGSGIGPSLSSLVERPVAQVARLIWSTRSPELTYGSAICREVSNVDPDAIVIDTDTMGRPDLIQVAWKVYSEMKAEAVFVLSNEATTKKVVYGLESRGVPAFGPIWDS